MDAEDILFILYTSGSTGKPKGRCALPPAVTWYYAEYTFKNVFQYSDGDIYWCTADIGWVTGHSYIVYGPLLSGATSIMFEGVPTWPDAGRFWEIIDKYKVTHFYTAPTAIRALVAQGDEWVKKHDPRLIKSIGNRWRTHQRRSLALVPRFDWVKVEMPDCGYLVADRNRRNYDFAAGRDYTNQTFAGNTSSPGDSTHFGRSRRKRVKREWC
jgi:acyl-CoA synthetase (AMP-forming)/AMP-acid ligase II